MADGVVGSNIAKYLIGNFLKDLYLVVVTKESGLYEVLANQGINTIVYESEQQVLDCLNFENIDVGILAWWPHILKGPLINYPKLGFINTHPSLLPFNRGKHPSFWAIVEQAPFGVSIHHATKEIDSGKIIAQKRINYDWCDSGESLYSRSQKEMVKLFESVYPVLRMGNMREVSQGNSDEGSFHFSCEIEQASKINLDESYLGRELLNKLRAKTFFGHSGCWFEEDGITYNITVNITKKEPKEKK